MPRFRPIFYSKSLLCVCRQQWLWRDSTFMQAWLSLRCSYILRQLSTTCTIRLITLNHLGHSMWLITQDFDNIVSMMWVSHIVNACACTRVYVNSVRCEVDWRPDCHGFTLPVQHHSNVEIGHEIFYTVIPIPSSYSKILPKPHSRSFGRSYNQTICRWEYLGMISLPSPPSINLAIIQMGTQFSNNIVSSHEPENSCEVLLYQWSNVRHLIFRSRFQKSISVDHFLWYIDCLCPSIKHPQHNGSLIPHWHMWQVILWTWICSHPMGPDPLLWSVYLLCIYKHQRFWKGWY